MTAQGFDDDQTRSFIPLTAGARVAHYEIISKIGAGGMGEVYLANDTKLDRKVALKFLSVHLSQDETSRARFTREAKAAAKLDHPNIVPVHEVGEYQGRPFFAMAYIKGQSLRDVIKRGKLSVQGAIDHCMQICDGLNEAHTAGIVHRDIKPGNIIIDTKNKPRILDFGLATISGEEKLTKTGSTLGTVGYMSPEQVRGDKIDHRSDLFSIGVVLYELLSGQNPFKADSEAATTHAITQINPQPLARFNRDVPEELQRIVDKALTKDVSLRYQHADGMLSDLQNLQNDILSQSINRSIPQGIKTRALLVATLTVITAFSLYFGFSYFGKSASNTTPSIAVLLLENIGESSDDFLSYGITQDIIIDIARAGLVRVSPMNDILNISDEGLPIRELAKRLRVRYIIDGSISRNDRGISVAAQLIDTQTGNTLWANRYTVPNDSAQYLQRKISNGVVRSLNITASVSHEKQIVNFITKSPVAYDFYLRGKFVLDKRESESDILVARGLFEKAADIDSQFIAAQNELGYTFALLGEYDTAQIIYVNAISTAETLGDEVGKATSLNLLGQLHIGLSDYRKALDYLKSGLAISSRMGDPVLTSKSLESLASYYENIDSPELTEEYLERARLFAEQLNDSMMIFNYYYILGWNYKSIGEIGKSFNHFSKALSIAKSIRNMNGEGITLLALSDVLLLQGKSSAAKDSSIKSLQILKKLGNIERVAATSVELANIYMVRGEYSKSLEIALEANVIASQLGIGKTAVWARNNIGLAYLNLGLHEKAVEYFKEVLQDSEILSETYDYDKVQSLGNIGDALSFPIDKKNYSSAIEYYEESMELSVKHGYQLLKCYQLASIGIVYAKMNDLENSLVYLRQAESIMDSLNAKYDWLWACSWLTLTELENGKLSRGRENLTKIENFVTSSEDPLDEIVTIWNISKSYLLLGDTATATEYFDDAYQLVMERAEKIEDSLHKTSYLTNVAENNEIIQYGRDVFGYK